MRNFYFLGLLLVVGCQTRSTARVDDPRLSIQDQQRNARERLALPDEGRPLGEGYARPGTVYHSK